MSSPMLIKTYQTLLVSKQLRPVPLTVYTGRNQGLDTPVHYLDVVADLFLENKLRFFDLFLGLLGDEALLIALEGILLSSTSLYLSL
jgi:hypothetical protein